MSQSELDVDDFSLEETKVVKQIKAEDLKKSGEIKDDGSVQTYSKIEQKVISNLDDQVNTILETLFNSETSSDDFKDISTALNKMGDKEVSMTSKMSSRMLSRPMRSLNDSEAGDGKNIASQIKQLRLKVNDLDPSKRSGLFSANKIMGIKIPFGLGYKVKSYFQDFQSAKTQLDSIVNSLYNGKEELMEDNAEIEQEREDMKLNMSRLEQYAYVMRQLDKKIEARLPAIEAESKLKANDIRQEILFPIRQKRTDLLQHMAVCMQGYMALGVIHSNNRELMRGVDRATNTTVAALTTAVMISQALGTQKAVMDTIDSVNSTTQNLIMKNAESLEQQGVMIQKQATSSAIDVKMLDDAFKKIFKAMDAIDSFREQALPKMKQTLENMETTVNMAKEKLQSREQNAVQFLNEMKEENQQSSNDGAVQVVKKNRKPRP